MSELRGKTSTPSFPPAHAQRMNQNRGTTDKPPGEPRPPSYQAEVLNPFVGQPAPPGHGHAARPAAARSAPAGPTRSAGGRAAVTVAPPAGGPGVGRGSEAEWQPGGRRPASAGGSEPRSRAAARPGPGPGPALPAPPPGSRVRPPRPPFVSGEPAAAVPAVQGVPVGGYPGGVLAASARPAPLCETRRDAESDTQTQVGTLPPKWALSRPSYTHTPRGLRDWWVSPRSSTQRALVTKSEPEIAFPGLPSPFSRPCSATHPTPKQQLLPKGASLDLPLLWSHPSLSPQGCKALKKILSE